MVQVIDVSAKVPGKWCLNRILCNPLSTLDAPCFYFNCNQSICFLVVTRAPFFILEVAKCMTNVTSLAEIPIHYQVQQCDGTHRIVNDINTSDIHLSLTELLRNATFRWPWQTNFLRRKITPFLLQTRYTVLHPEICSTEYFASVTAGEYHFIYCIKQFCMRWIKRSTIAI